MREYNEKQRQFQEAANKGTKSRSGSNTQLTHSVLGNEVSVLFYTETVLILHW